MIFGLFDQLFPIMFTIIFLFVIGTFMSLAQETRDFSRGRNAPLAPFRDIICRCFQQHLKHGLAGASPRL